jgi:acyl-CoA dehydrogenase
MASTMLWVVAAMALPLVLAYVNAPGVAWMLAAALLLALAWVGALLPPWLVISLAVVILVLSMPLLVPPLRRRLVSAAVLKAFRKVLPPMSQTEREALEAGTVWWDGELFSGRPQWRKLLDLPPAKLSDEEQRFLDEEVETLCGLVSDWETTNVYRDLPPHVWRYIKDHGFLGIIIPKEYGGLGFSAYAHSEIVQ